MNAAVSPPTSVAEAHDRARRRGFVASSDGVVGPLLAVLAGAVPDGGRVLEIGTGCGAGAAWLAHGVAGRDVQIVSVEQDADLARESAAAVPDAVEVLAADIGEALPRLGSFDLVFADAEGGKWTGFAQTRDAVRPGGVLVLDDMDVSRYASDEHRRTVARVLDDIRQDRRFLVAELDAGSGIVLATRLRTIEEV